MNHQSDHSYSALSQAIHSCMPQKRVQNKLAVGVMALGLALSAASPVCADTFNVTNTDDSGSGSFRQAILDAEANPGNDTINMTSVSGDITPVTPFPKIYESVYIAGPGRNKANIKGELVFSTKGDYWDENSFLGDTRINSIRVQGGSIYGPGVRTHRLSIENGAIGGISVLDVATVSVSNSLISEGAGIEVGINARMVVSDSRIENTAIFTNDFPYEFGSSPSYLPSQPHLQFNSCLISGNSIEAAFRVTDSAISNNQILPSFGWYIENSTVTDNLGGIPIGSVINSKVSGNSGGLVGSGSDGLVGSSMSIRNSTIINNGKGISVQYEAFYTPPRLVIENTTIANNNGVAIESGGGLYIRIENSTISGNKGEAISHTDNPGRLYALDIINTTITGNEGGVVLNASSYTQPLQVTNSIISGNDLNGKVDLVSEDKAFDISYSLIQNPGSALINDVIPGSNLIGIDPMLASLADNGGPTQTHALLPGSPAIDAGDDATCTGADQRGVERPQGAGCDMGAYEVEVTVVPPVALCDIDLVSIGGNCVNEVVARSIADIDAYVASNFGRHTLANGKKAFKNLRLLGSIGQSGIPLDVSSPCGISVNANAELTGSDITLHARQGLSVNWSADIDASGEACLISDRQHALLNGGNVVNADTLAIRGAKKAIVGFQAVINVNGAAELISTGAGENSNAKVGNKTTVTAERFTMQADNVTELAFRANITSTGEINITSGNLTTSNTRLTNRSSVQAGTDVTVNSGGNTNIGFHTTVTAGNNLDVNAKTDAECSVASITSITYSSKSGNCSNKLP